MTAGSPRGGVAAAHRLAARAGASMLTAGGNAVDAAVAAAAAMAVTSPHLCGLGGDLFALVCEPGGGRPLALNASGRAGSGADPGGLRAAGAARMPFRGDIRAVTVPGCVDGLLALGERLGRLTAAQVLEPAVALARGGFPVSSTLADASLGLAPELRRAAFGSGDPLHAGVPLRLPGVAGVLDAIAAEGRRAFYEGEAGAELRTLGGGLFSAEDLARPHADWVAPLTVEAFGHRLWTVPPNSQGYLTLAGAFIADAVDVPADPDAPAWAYGLVEAARAAAHDRVATLHEHADGPALLAPARLTERAGSLGVRAAARSAGEPGEPGDTTCVCAVDGEGRGVSLILSNCAGFGVHRVLPGSGLFLHNRGIGFTLEAGHPAEYRPGARPPHTLSPCAVTERDGTLRAVLGTMGGDAQPQIVLQLLARLLHARVSPGAQAVIDAPRWVLARESSTGFDTWEREDPPTVVLEHDAPAGWAPALRDRGHVVREAAAGESAFGHAQMIVVDDAGAVSGAADPRAVDGAFLGR